MQGLSDQSVVARCINGEKGAWDIFVERYAQLIFWAIRLKLKRVSYPYNQQDLEDIFQNVFVLLWEKDKLRQIRNRKNISGWLTIVAANCAFNYFRNKSMGLCREELLAEEVACFDCQTTKILDQKNLHDIVAKVLSCLSARETIILKLSYLYEKTHQEIGRLLNLPANTVSSIIKRIKERLKEKLAKAGWENF